MKYNVKFVNTEVCYRQIAPEMRLIVIKNVALLRNFKMDTA